MKTLSFLLLPLLLVLAGCSTSDTSVSPAGAPGMQGNTGTGGALARFTITGDHLFVVDDQRLYSYKLQAGQAPTQMSATPVGFNIETIYAFRDKLFIGSQNAMHIYSIANPEQPTELGIAQHVTACDPAIANDSFAYVTVRSGTNCGGATNALISYNVRNIMAPVETSQLDLAQPQGLGFGSGGRLYVCDGDAGLHVYSLSNPQQPSLIKTITGQNFHDVIVLDDLLVCSVEGGTALYSRGSVDNVQFLATIAN